MSVLQPSAIDTRQLAHRIGTRSKRVATLYRYVLQQMYRYEAGEMTTIGYARVSTAHQDTAAQVTALEQAGCTQVFHEAISSCTPDTKRAQLQAALATLTEGDELVVAKLDRLGRTQVEVINRLHDLQQRGIDVRTLDGLLNTAALGKMAPLVVGLLTGLAEVERNLIRERTQESVDHRRALGMDLGGRRKSYTAEQANEVIRLRGEGLSFRAIVNATGLGLGTVQRIIKAAAVVEA